MVPRKERDDGNLCPVRYSSMIVFHVQRLNYPAKKYSKFEAECYAESSFELVLTLLLMLQVCMFWSINQNG